MITSKEVYHELISNDEIMDIYQKIEEQEIKDGGWAFHNIEHIKNVSLIAEKILKDLSFDEDTIYLCKIACLLHDVGALQGKDNHAERSFEFAKKLLEERNWLFNGYESVLDAIQNHSEGFDTDNIITLSIILADKLDIKKTRISEEGKKVEGNRQYGHIEDITVDIQNNTLTVRFITDGKIDLEEFNHYYFTKKLFKAINAFSQKLNLQYFVFIDQKSVWEDWKEASN